MPGSVWLIRLITFYVIKRFSHPVGTEIDNFIKSCTAIYFCTALERLESSDVAEPSPFQWSSSGGIAAVVNSVRRVDFRAVLAVHPVAVRNRERSPRPGTGFTAPNTVGKSVQVMGRLHACMIAQRDLVP